MDLRERRLLLSSEPNPDRRLDYVSSLGASINASVTGSVVQFRVSYVPDQLILVPTSLNDYLEKTGALQWPSLEEFAVTVLNDINDELIARWIEVSFTAEADGRHHEVMLEERQPQWQDQGILSRLPLP